MSVQKSIAAQLEELAEIYHLAAMYAFGSRAKEIYARVQGESVELEHPNSDVDIGVLPSSGFEFTVQEKVKLAIRIEDVFDVPRVDLVVLHEASPFLALEIVRGELLVVTDQDFEAEYQLFVLRQAGDLAGWEKERQKMLLSGEAI